MGPSSPVFPVVKIRLETNITKPSPFGIANLLILIGSTPTMSFAAELCHRPIHDYYLKQYYCSGPLRDSVRTSMDRAFPGSCEIARAVPGLFL